MATLTSNISNVSLAVSGNTQQSATISWPLTSVPSGSTISSCTLTGKATASMSKGSATITVNGQTVSSGSNFTINLGTGNTTSSVTATAKGGNKNASGTVTFSNLVYTVNYTPPTITYTVTFVDHDGTILKTQIVDPGGSATAPADPVRDGYIFSGWSADFSDINADLTVTAQYVIPYTVRFIDYDGTVLKTEAVVPGGSATPPLVNRYGYRLTGWSVDFMNVNSNITTIAQYEPLSILALRENGEWGNISQIFKRVSGEWVEQTNNTWPAIFSNNAKFKQNSRTSRTSAILYSDGCLVFSDYPEADRSHGDVVTYYDWNFDTYTATHKPPWISNESVLSVRYECVGYTAKKLPSEAYGFFSLPNVTSFYFGSATFESVRLFSFMFEDCSKIEYLDLSMCNPNHAGYTNSMFRGCTNLKTVDISNFDFSNVTQTSYMFRDCSNITIYVKDEVAKTKIEASSYFPSTATVIIGSPA